MSTYIFETEHNMLPNMLQIQIQKRKQRVTAAHYVLIYKGLTLMSQNNLPCSKYRISNRKAVLAAMIENRFIEEADKKRMVSEKLHKDAKYYVIAPKGYEYMRAFERLEGMFD